MPRKRSYVRLHPDAWAAFVAIVMLSSAAWAQPSGGHAVAAKLEEFLGSPLLVPMQELWKKRGGWGGILSAPDGTVIAFRSPGGPTCRSSRDGGATWGPDVEIGPGATVHAVDVGVGRPTGDIRVEPALDHERFTEAVEAGRSAVDALDADLLVLGEMGIGNTTAAAAVTAALLGGEPAEWVGRGTGVDDDGLARKQAAVQQAVARVAGVDDPLEVLRQVGGAELVAMAAAVVAARQRNLPVLLDGYVVTAAALPLHAAAPGALDHCRVGHCSAEPGHRRLVQQLGQQPLLDLGMRLGEGSGAMAAVPLVAMACAGITHVPTFGEWFG